MTTLYKLCRTLDGVTLLYSESLKDIYWIVRDNKLLGFGWAGAGVSLCYVHNRVEAPPGLFRACNRDNEDEPYSVVGFCIEDLLLNNTLVTDAKL